MYRSVDPRRERPHNLVFSMISELLDARPKSLSSSLTSSLSSLGPTTTFESASAYGAPPPTAPFSPQAGGPATSQARGGGHAVKNPASPIAGLYNAYAGYNRRAPPPPRVRWALACRARNLILPYLGGGGGVAGGDGGWGGDSMLVDAAVLCWRECILQTPQTVSGYAQAGGGAAGLLEAAFARAVEGSSWAEVEVPGGEVTAAVQVAGASLNEAFMLDDYVTSDLASSPRAPKMAWRPAGAGRGDGRRVVVWQQLYREVDALQEELIKAAQAVVSARRGMSVGQRAMFEAERVLKAIEGSHDYWRGEVNAPSSLDSIVPPPPGVTLSCPPPQVWSLRETVRLLDHLWERYPTTGYLAQPLYREGSSAMATAGHEVNLWDMYPADAAGFMLRGDLESRRWGE